jgi:urease accessory protein
VTTVLVEASGDGPFRVVRAAAGGTCEAVIVQTRGGMIGGDRWRVEVRVGPGGSVRLRSVGALLLHPGPTAFRLLLVAGSGARLSWRGPGVIAAPGARGRLLTRVDRASEARVGFSEPARLDPGAEVVLRTVARAGGRILLDDALILDAASGAPSRLGPARHVGSALLLGTGRVRVPLLAPTTEMIVAAGRPRSGVSVVRAVGGSLQELDGVLGPLLEGSVHRAAKGSV